jgi:hypothetical protein
MKTLSIIRVLDYYDIPQLFVAEDAIDILYLCLLYDHTEEGYTYIASQLSSKKLNDFTSGHLDLRNIYMQPEIEDALYTVTVKQDIITAIPLSVADVTNDMLPEEGYFYPADAEEDESLIAETANCKHPVMRLGFEDLNNSHDIDAVCLSKAINTYQATITNCYKKIYGKENAEQAILRVTHFQAASFDVHFMVNTPLNLFGSSDIDEVFKQVDSLLKAPDDDVMREKIRFLAGHTISSYKNFISVLLENRLSVKYKWVSSLADRKVVSNHVNLQRVEHIYNILLENQELASEQKEFLGVFLASNVKSGTWKLGIEDSNKSVSGKSGSPDILSGIIMKQQMYKITCREIQEQDMASLKITKRLILDKIEEA